MTAIKPLGLEHLIGIDGGSKYSLAYTVTGNGSEVRNGTMFVTFDENDDIVSTSFADGSQDSVFFRSDSLGNYDGSIVSLCPSDFQGTFTYTCSLALEETYSTGVYEYIVMVSAVAAVSLLLAVIGTGIMMAKRSINTINEETSEDDNLEYYIGHNGKEYWRIKNRRYHG